MASPNPFSTLCITALLCLSCAGTEKDPTDRWRMDPPTPRTSEATSASVDRKLLAAETPPVAPPFVPSAAALKQKKSRDPGQRPSLARRLRDVRVPGLQVEDETSLRRLVGSVQALTGLPFVVTPAAEDAVLNDGIVFNFNLSNPITAYSLLNVITDMAGDGVAWTIRHDVVLITTKEKARGELVLRGYDVRALTHPVTSFVAPRIGRIGISDDDDDEAYGSVEKVEPRMEMDTVVALIEDTVAADTWGVGGASLRAANGMLWVRQTPDVHRKIRTLLQQLGAF